MTRVTIFGDESGVMPADDGDGPFCTAAIAVSQLPKLGARSGHRDDVLSACTAAGGVPQIVCVCPRPGYGQQLRSKTSKMTTMARASRLITGSHEYLPDQGYSPRNLIWIRMAVCLARVVVLAGSLEALEKVVIALDRKTITPRERALFTERLRLQSRDILGESSNPYEVEVHWSDDPEAAALQDGLFLADHLSRLGRAALEAGTEEVLAQELGVARLDLFYDTTSDVVAPLPWWSIQKWKSRTGLPEPSE